MTVQFEDRGIERPLEGKGRAECPSSSSYPGWTARINERVSMGRAKGLGRGPMAEAVCARGGICVPAMHCPMLLTRGIDITTA